jgi:hypothetical protein
MPLSNPAIGVEVGGASLTFNNVFSGQQTFYGLVNAANGLIVCGSADIGADVTFRNHCEFEQAVGFSGSLSACSPATFYNEATFAGNVSVCGFVALSGGLVVCSAAEFQNEVSSLGPVQVHLGNVRVNNYPTADPHVAGRLWVDNAAGSVLKVSQG